MNRINTGPLPGSLVKLIGFNYHHPSAEDAWRRILSFFGAHLDGGQPGSRPSR
jgi:carboxymethylenebutenolidase